MSTLDQIVRIAVIVLVVSFVVVRIVMYFRGGMARRPALRSTTTTPFTMPPSLPETPESLSQTPSPLSGARAASALGTLVTVLVALGLNLALWFALFVPPFMNNIPVIWRLFIGIFANFYLLRFARRVGQRAEP